MTDDVEKRKQRWWYASVFTLLVLGAFFARVHAGAHVVEPDRFWISDPDTLRRLVRLERLVDGTHSYPFVEEYDGYPSGSVLHWTLPMDGVLIALDRVVRPFYPQARYGEAGAVWAGVLLSTAAVLLFGLLARRILAPLPALFATACYAFSYTAIGVGSFGNGDHQSLQHLALVGALMGFLVLLRHGGSGRAVRVGAWLGLSLWVSTESQAVLLMMAAAAFLHLLCSPREELMRRARWHSLWAASAAVLVFFSGWIEHARPFAYTWDQVSALQLHALLMTTACFALVPLLATRVRVFAGASWRSVVSAALLAALIGSLPWFVTPLGKELKVQLDQLAAANRWVQVMVSEYLPLLTVRGALRFEKIEHRFTYLIVLFPVLLYGCARDPRCTSALRAAFLLLVIGCFAFACYEVKLAHFFQILWPLVIVVGGTYWIRRLLPTPRFGFTSQRVQWAAAGLVLFLILWKLPAGTRELTPQQLAVDELCAALRELEAPGPNPNLEAAVLAPWSLGAAILYYARLPVVAPGYHRNLDGIHDGLRAFVARGSAEIEPILREHNVRWVVMEPSFNFFEEVGRVLPELGSFVRSKNVRYVGNGEYAWDYDFEIDPKTKRARFEDTVLWNLGMQSELAPHPQRRVRYESKVRRAISSLKMSAPIYRVLEVRLSEELER